MAITAAAAGPAVRQGAAVELVEQHGAWARTLTSFSHHPVRFVWRITNDIDIQGGDVVSEWL
jgi:hypothetical protein